MVGGDQKGTRGLHARRRGTEGLERLNWSVNKKGQVGQPPPDVMLATDP